MAPKKTGALSTEKFIARKNWRRSNRKILSQIIFWRVSAVKVTRHIFLAWQHQNFLIFNWQFHIVPLWNCSSNASHSKILQWWTHTKFFNILYPICVEICNIENQSIWCFWCTWARNIWRGALTALSGQKIFWRRIFLLTMHQFFLAPRATIPDCFVCVCVYMCVCVCVCRCLTLEHPYDLCRVIYMYLWNELWNVAQILWKIKWRHIC